MRPYRLAAAVAVAVAAAVVAGGYGAGRSPAPSAPGTASVVRVVDGDTVRVKLAGKEEPVRLIGIDTPETHGAGGLRECFGKEATARLEALLPKGTAVRVVRDVEARDRYRRLLAYLYREEDGMFVNLVLAEEGFAAALTIPPNVAHSSRFVAAAAEARRRSLGLWGRCGDADRPIGSRR